MKNMCKKAIYLEDAIEEINKIYNRIELIREKHSTSLLNEYAICLAEEWDVIEALNNLPSIQPEQQWMPCSKELPKTDKWRTEFNVTTETGMIRSMDWENTIVRGEPVSRWIWQGRISPWEVVAWMPLPEPYKGADDD